MKKLLLFAIFLFAFPVSSFANYAFVGSAQTTTTQHVTYSATSTNTLIVIASNNAATSGITISDGSNTYNYIGGIQTNPSLGIWWAHVTTGGSLTIAATGASYGIAVFEYSGLATSAYISSTFEGRQQAGPGLGANVVTTGTASTISSAPAMLFCFSYDTQIQQGGTNPAPTVGTSPLAFTGRTVGWLGGSSQQAAVAEDYRFTSTGSGTPTVGTSGNAQFDTFLTIGAGFVESGSTPTTTAQPMLTLGVAMNVIPFKRPPAKQAPRFPIIHDQKRAA